MLTHDACNKWYFTSRCTLLEVGIPPMLAHKCKQLPEMDSVHIDIRLSILSLAIDKHIIEVTGAKSRTDLNRFDTHLLNVSGALLSPFGITDYFQNIPLGVLTAVYGMFLLCIMI